MRFPLFVLALAVFAFAGLYTVHDFGDVVVFTINRSAFVPLEKGYWLLVSNQTPGDISMSVLEELAKYRRDRGVPWEYGLAVVNGTLKVVGRWPPPEVARRLGAEPPDRALGAVLGALEGAGARQALVTIYENYIDIRLAADGGLNPAEMARRLKPLTRGPLRGYGIVVVETFGSGYGVLPGEDLLAAVRGLTCAFGLGEGVYGIDVVFDVDCVRGLSDSFDRAVENVTRSVLALDPLIRRYYPHQDVVVLIAKRPDIRLASSAPPGTQADAQGRQHGALSMAAALAAVAIAAIALLAKRRG